MLMVSCNPCECNTLLNFMFAEKVMYSSPNFDPKVFLTRVHQETTAADLEAGALTLKTDLKGRTKEKKKLVKENFDCFVSCKTTIDGKCQCIYNFNLFPPQVMG